MDNSNANGGTQPFGSGANNYIPPQNLNPVTPTPNIPNPQPDQHKSFFGRHFERNIAPVVNDTNLQTQSLIESPRDMSSVQLEEAKQRAEEARKLQQRQQTVRSAKRTGIYMSLAVFLLIFIGVFAFLLFSLGGSFNKRADGYGSDEEGPKKHLPVVVGYKCETEKCGEVAKMPDGRILLRDDSYYIYDTETKKRILTTIDNQDYSAIETFEWGGKIYAILDPLTDKNAVYSITNNRMLTSYIYDEIYTDPQDEVYKDMLNLPAEYIVARSSGPTQYYLLNLSDGKNLVSGQKRVLYIDGFFLSYNDAGQKLAFQASNSKPYMVSSSKATIYYVDSKIMRLEPDGEYSNVTYYSKDGQENYDYYDLASYQNIQGLKSSEMMSYIESHPDIYHKLP